MLPLLYRHKYRADDNEFPLRPKYISVAPTCRVGVRLECARHHFSQAGGGIPARFTAATIHSKQKERREKCPVQTPLTPGKQVTVDCFQATHKISMKYPHNLKQKRGNDSSQRLSPLGSRKEDGTQHVSHITPSDGTFCGGHDSGTPLRGWTTQHSLQHSISSLSASSPARLYSSPKTLQLPSSLLIHVVFSTVSAAADSSHNPVLILSRSSTHPWKRPLFCSCWSRMFSSFRGLGMKPISQPSFTRRPIHQSLLNFYRLER